MLGKEKTGEEGRGGEGEKGGEESPADADTVTEWSEGSSA